MKFRALVCVSLFAAALMLTPAAFAQTPPAGAIYTLSVSHPGAVSTTESLFTTSFVADNASEFVSFAFREIPAYWALDDTSVIRSGDLTLTNLLADPGFESATVGQNVPTGWNRWIQPIDVSAIGVVVSNSSSGGCATDTPTHGGSQFWCDGSVEGYDAVYQQLTTLTVGATYNVSWYLGHDTGAAPSAPGIDMLVYAGDSIPVGTVPVGTPEPASVALMGLSMAALGIMLARRRKA
jgi:hypothetical protein